jgi:hypothetical protein
VSLFTDGGSSSFDIVRRGRDSLGNWGSSYLEIYEYQLLEAGLFEV